jgi:hypothetical protein
MMAWFTTALVLAASVAAPQRLVLVEDASAGAVAEALRKAESLRAIDGTAVYQLLRPGSALFTVGAAAPAVWTSARLGDVFQAGRARCLDPRRTEPGHAADCLEQLRQAMWEDHLGRQLDDGGYVAAVRTFRRLADGRFETEVQGHFLAEPSIRTLSATAPDAKQAVEAAVKLVLALGKGQGVKAPRPTDADLDAFRSPPRPFALPQACQDKPLPTELDFCPLQPRNHRLRDTWAATVKDRKGARLEPLRCVGQAAAHDAVDGERAHGEVTLECGPIRVARSDTDAREIDLDGLIAQALEQLADRLCQGK